MGLCELGLAVLILASLATRQTPAPSPEVHADGTITFRLKTPNARSVTVSIEGYDSAKMVKNGDVWEYTSPALSPDLYGYAFSVDGTPALDPQNPLTKPNLIWMSNMVLVPGDKEWETKDVPHGVVAHVLYHSKVIGDNRDYYVYTPPGYDARARKTYPVLYLLHGYSDSADAWTAVGRANIMMDNLIATHRATPMIIVMPLGYGVPDFANPFGRNFSDRRLTDENYQKFREALVTEVMPQVEKSFRVTADRDHRAIAGLSMGGAETLFTGLNRLDLFGYVGSFSAGGLNRETVADLAKIAPEKLNALKVFWISCGTEDGLITPNRAMTKAFHDAGVKVQAIETPGRHAWMVWRRNFINFSVQLFK